MDGCWRNVARFCSLKTCRLKKLYEVQKGSEAIKFWSIWRVGERESEGGRGAFFCMGIELKGFVKWWPLHFFFGAAILIEIEEKLASFFHANSQVQLMIWRECIIKTAIKFLRDDQDNGTWSSNRNDAFCFSFINILSFAFFLRFHRKKKMKKYRKERGNSS